MRASIIILLLCPLYYGNVKAQISPELQRAIESVPYAKFDYPANRDRTKPPQVASPQAYEFAYYQLPYAIDLDMEKNDALNTYVSIVMVDFSSVSLSAEKETQILRNSISELRSLLSSQYDHARMYGYYAHISYSYSMLAQIAREGNAIIAIREVLSTKDLLNSLTLRLQILSE